MLDLIIHGGEVVTPIGVARHDIGVTGEIITAVAGPGALAGVEAERRIDASGKIVMPGGIDPHDCVKIVRGKPGMIERMVVEVPTESSRFVSDITIGGEPVRYGGQIAECITVKLVGGATKLGSVRNGLTPCDARCCSNTSNASRLRDPVGWDAPTPTGFVDALGAKAP